MSIEELPTVVLKATLQVQYKFSWKLQQRFVHLFPLNVCQSSNIDSEVSPIVWVQYHEKKERERKRNCFSQAEHFEKQLSVKIESQLVCSGGDGDGEEFSIRLVFRTEKDVGL